MTMLTSFDLCQIMVKALNLPEDLQICNFEIRTDLHGVATVRLEIFLPKDLSISRNDNT